jgi:hypothetical protein
MDDLLYNKVKVLERRDLGVHDQEPKISPYGSTSDWILDSLKNYNFELT